MFNVFEIKNVIDVEFPRSHVSTSRSWLPRVVGDGGENESQESLTNPQSLSRGVMKAGSIVLPRPIPGSVSPGE